MPLRLSGHINHRTREACQGALHSTKGVHKVAATTAIGDSAIFVRSPRPDHQAARLGRRGRGARTALALLRAQRPRWLAAWPESASPRYVRHDRDRRRPPAAGRVATFGRRAFGDRARSQPRRTRTVAPVTMTRALATRGGAHYVRVLGWTFPQAPRLAVASSFEPVDTRFTELVSCRLPFQLAVLGGVGTTELAVAVSSGGGLGMVPFGVEPPPGDVGPSGIGFLIPYLPPIEAIVQAAGQVKVVEFFEGDPDHTLVKAGHSGDALVSWQVGSVEEGQAAEAAGCDLIVAQGVEAGGHVRGNTPLDELLPAILVAVGVPVVATGGIGTAERVAALLAAGADAVRVGTRFLACPECNTHAGYVEALLEAGADDTVLTGDFDDDGHWPAAVRVLGGSLVRARRAGNRSTMPPTRDAKDPLAMACYAGMSVTDLTQIQPAAEVLRDLVDRL